MRFIGSWERKLEINRILLLAGLGVSLSACSQVNEFCTGASGAPIVGEICAPASIASAAKDFATGRGGDEAPPAPKSFHVSKLVMKDFGDNSDVMAFVMDSQDKYKAGDYGVASDEQKKAGIGRYQSDQLGKTIIIRDLEKAWNVAYESESN
jgi:hypothetical protein